MAHAAWRPREAHGKPPAARKNDLPVGVFAFPKQRKEPLADAKHVRNAIARFDRVTDVDDGERDLAFSNIMKATTR